MRSEEDMRVDELLAALMAAWLASELSKKELAGRARLHENTLRLFNPETLKNWNPALSTVRKLEACLLGSRPRARKAA
jgi:hypothetical protein